MKVSSPLVSENQQANLYSTSYTVDQETKMQLFSKVILKQEQIKKIMHIYIAWQIYSVVYEPIVFPDCLV